MNIKPYTIGDVVMSPHDSIINTEGEAIFDLLPCNGVNILPLQHKELRSARASYPFIERHLNLCYISSQTGAWEAWDKTTSPDDVKFKDIITEGRGNYWGEWTTSALLKNLDDVVVDMVSFKENIALAGYAENDSSAGATFEFVVSGLVVLTMRLASGSDLTTFNGTPRRHIDVFYTLLGGEETLFDSSFISPVYIIPHDGKVKLYAERDAVEILLDVDITDLEEVRVKDAFLERSISGTTAFITLGIEVMVTDTMESIDERIPYKVVADLT